MQQTHAVVVWDPSGKLNTGEVIADGRRLKAMQGNGVAILPIDPDILGEPSAVSGYMQRHFGNRGHAFNKGSGERGPAALLYLHEDRTYLHWKARIVPLEKGAEAKATLRLATDTVQVSTVFGGLAAGSPAAEVGSGDTKEPDELGGWTIGGTVRLSITKPGLLGLCLYGVGRGIGVQWLAVTQTTDANNY